MRVQLNQMKVNNLKELVGDEGWQELQSILSEGRAYFRDLTQWLGVGMVMIHEDIFQSLTSSEMMSAFDFGNPNPKSYFSQNIDTLIKTSISGDVADLTDFGTHGTTYKWHISKISKLCRKLPRPQEGASTSDLFTMDKIETLKNHWVDLEVLNITLVNLRIMWAPQCGKGQQSQNIAAHQLLAEAVFSLGESKKT